MLCVFRPLPAAMVEGYAGGQAEIQTARTTGTNGRTTLSEPPVYIVRIEGYLDPRWSDWFDGMRIEHGDTETLLSGPLADQAALHGLLGKLRDLGLVLLSVQRAEPHS